MSSAASADEKRAVAKVQTRAGRPPPRTQRSDAVNDLIGGDLRFFSEKRQNLRKRILG